MESHDGLTIDDWSFDHRLLQVTRAAEGPKAPNPQRLTEHIVADIVCFRYIMGAC
jgi:hypothetical protein